MVMKGDRIFPQEYERWEADGVTWIVQDLPPEDDEKFIEVLITVMKGDRIFPQEYERWEADGVTWIAQDLPPEDDEKFIEVLVDLLGTDEVLCSTTRLSEHPESVKGISDYWRVCLAERTSIACYREIDGVRTLAGGNCCVIAKKDDKPSIEIQGDEWKTVFEGLKFVEDKCNPFEYLGEDKLLVGYGLVVKREFRGAKLGARILNAREPLCKQLNVKAATTVFTGISSQKLAARCGYIVTAEATLHEMSQAGLKYPKGDQRSIKLMVKKFE
ncbi:hypothetical protein RR46_02342 [Papilio xuthus]|uniref:N-acetyltransferase domain-containing protein n=1 Tax=Papilio xuthus TaxID=66420 RepID=A0A194Q6V7_PAPXU|nr:hypothetical protein RR46_02342 [Papilio xuthus]